MTMHYHNPHNESTIGALLDAVHTGEIRVPDWHRGYVWREKDVLYLFDSLFKGFSVGSLTLWGPGGEPEGEAIGVGEKSHAARLLTVDAHQRLAALYTVMTGTPVVDDRGNEVSPRLAFSPRDRRFRIARARVLQDPEYLPDISVLWCGDLSLYGITGAFLNRLRCHRVVPVTEEDTLMFALARLKSLSSCPMSIRELGASYTEAEAGEIYIRENTRRASRKAKTRRTR